METGFDITIRKCIDKSIFVSLDNIACTNGMGGIESFDGVGENFDSLEEALGYVRGLHDAATIIQNHCDLIRIPETEEAHDEV